MAYKVRIRSFITRAWGKLKNMEKGRNLPLVAREGTTLIIMVMTRDRAYGGLNEILRRVYHSQEVEMFVAEFLKQ